MARATSSGLLAAVDRALADYAQLVVAGTKARVPVRSPVSASSFGATSKTYRPGHVSGHTPMAHPVCPWPYGTIIRPTPENMSFPAEHRQMVIGLAPNGEEAICAVALIPEIVKFPAGYAPDFYLHTISNIHERWIEAEEDS